MIHFVLNFFLVELVTPLLQTTPRARVNLHILGSVATALAGAAYGRTRIRFCARCSLVDPWSSPAQCTSSSAGSRDNFMCIHALKTAQRVAVIVIIRHLFFVELLAALVVLTTPTTRP